MIKIFARAIASLFGIGFVPAMPGTVASAATLVGTWLVLGCSWQLMLVSAMAVFLIGLVVTHIATGGRGDPSWVVIDEAAGMLLALVVVPHTTSAFILAFGLFRFFDIYKPFGISRIQNIPGAWGVMLDDIAAGLAAAMVMQAIIYVKPF